MQFHGGNRFFQHLIFVLIITLSGCQSLGDYNYRDVEGMRAYLQERPQSREELIVHLQNMLVSPEKYSLETAELFLDQLGDLGALPSKSQFSLISIISQDGGVYTGTVEGTRISSAERSKLVIAMSNRGLDWSSQITQPLLSGVSEQNKQLLGGIVFSDICSAVNQEAIRQMRFKTNPPTYGWTPNAASWCLYGTVGNGGNIPSASLIGFLTKAGANPNLGTSHKLAKSLGTKQYKINHSSMLALIKGGADPDLLKDGKTLEETYIQSYNAVVRAQEQKVAARRQNQEDWRFVGQVVTGVGGAVVEHGAGANGSSSAQISSAAIARPSGTSSTTTGGNVSSSGSELSESYPISCESGVNSTIPISAKTPACMSAKKFYAKTFSCNRVRDMEAAAARCTSACGRQDCAEIN